jgi:hypothetical protein
MNDKWWWVGIVFVCFLGACWLLRRWIKVLIALGEESGDEHKGKMSGKQTTQKQNESSK